MKLVDVPTFTQDMVAVLIKIKTYVDSTTNGSLIMAFGLGRLFM
jgi:hypothetical protein